MVWSWVGATIVAVHLLPFYPSNADAGFSPLTHKEVDPRYGDWEDIEGLVVVGFETDSDSWGAHAEVLRSPNTHWSVCLTNKLGRTQGQ